MLIQLLTQFQTFTDNNMTEQQTEALAKFNHARDAMDAAEAEVEAAFVGFRELTKQGKFIEAREYLRPMPQCAGKTLFFREIILTEGKQ